MRKIKAPAVILREPIKSSLTGIFFDAKSAKRNGMIFSKYPNTKIGNPITKKLLEQAGCQVVAYKGNEISVKGGGGPTCLTRPLKRTL